jgi:hypothetical protein
MLGGGLFGSIIPAAPKGNSYSERARLAKDLSDKILTAFFSKADFKDILSLSSVSQCPKYVFTTAEALQTLFKKIQIDPKLGARGEIVYAPITQLSPGLFKEKESSQEILERTRTRNQMCVDVAYMYVRIFQIYGALALTVIDTDPTLRRGFQSGQKGLQQSTFFGGAGGQSGGASSSITTRTEIGRQMIGTVFEPLMKFFVIPSSGANLIKLNDGNKEADFIVAWKRPARTSAVELELRLCIRQRPPRGH